MNKKIIAAALSLSLLLMGGTVMAKNTQANQSEAKIKAESNYAFMSALSLQETERETEGTQNQCTAEATIEAQADHQIMQGQAASSFAGTVTGVGTINGGYAIQVEKQNGDTAVINTNAETKLIYNGKQLNTAVDLNSSGQLNISLKQDGETLSIYFTSTGQGAATSATSNKKQKSAPAADISKIDSIDKIDGIDDIDEIDKIDDIDRIDDLDKVFKYIHLSRLDGIHFIDEMDELEELQELPEEFNEELNELDELDEVGKYIHLV